MKMVSPALIKNKPWREGFPVFWHKSPDYVIMDLSLINGTPVMK